MTHYSTTTKNSKAKQGFTLIELSIVLVIIGLIVGGVLVGQDLIKAAEIRASAGMLEKTNTAVNTFRVKYNAIPGDIDNPGTFGLSATNQGGAGLGDGDQVVESGSCSNAYGIGGESLLFWTHLNEANLITGDTSGNADYTAVAALTIDDGDLPGLPMGASRMHVTNASGSNYYVLASHDSTTITTCAITATDSFTTTEAFQFDTKIDDGSASGGQIISILDGAAPTAAGGGSGTPDTTGTDDCYDSGTGVYAMTSDALSNHAECQLRAAAQF